MARPDEILAEAANTFKSRNPVYGDGWVRVGEVIAALFPQGIELRSPEDHERYSQIIMIAVKLTRYTNDWDKPHQDSIHDLTVYGAILEHIDAKIAERAKVWKTTGDGRPRPSHYVSPEVTPRAEDFADNLFGIDPNEELPLEAIWQTPIAPPRDGLVRGLERIPANWSDLMGERYGGNPPGGGKVG